MFASGKRWQVSRWEVVQTRGNLVGTHMLANASLPESAKLFWHQNLPRSLLAEILLMFPKLSRLQHRGSAALFIKRSKIQLKMHLFVFKYPEHTVQV